MKKKIFIFSFIIIIIDQLVKVLVENNLHSSFIIIDNFFSFSKVYNTGAAFSIFTDQRWMLIIINILILGYILYMIKNFKQSIRNTLAFSFIIGGLIGNLIDRIVYGHVIDYIKLVFGNYHYPVFNIADMAVVVGVILLVIAIIKKEDVYENSSK